jgi:hypothetical protein
MNRLSILVNFIVIITSLGIIFGLGFGFALPKNLNAPIKTTCMNLKTYENVYHCCNAFCNNSLPFCNDLIRSNISGKCCNGTNCIGVCGVVCGNCVNVTNTVLYGKDQLYANVTFDCRNNQTCVDYYSENYNLTCWYNRKDVTDVRFIDSVVVPWYIYYIIGLSCTFLMLYIPIIIMWNLFMI